MHVASLSIILTIEQITKALTRLLGCSIKSDITGKIMIFDLVPLTRRYLNY